MLIITFVLALLSKNTFKMQNKFTVGVDEIQSFLIRECAVMFVKLLKLFSI